jgi:TonB family protein
MPRGEAISFLPFDNKNVVKTHLYLPILICLSALLAPLCIADTTTNLHNVFIFMPTPRYPLDASERRSDGWRRIEGVTVVRMTLDANGKVAAVQVMKSSGNKSLDVASTEALRQWRARPGKAGRFFDVPVKFAKTSPTRSQSSDGLGMSKSSDAGNSMSARP